jgi:putative SOS response-associated peptidase YedK
MCYSAMVKQSLKYLEQEFGATVIRDSLVHYELWNQKDPKTFRPLTNDDARIFPMNFTYGIAAAAESNVVIQPMRYQVWPASFAEDPKHLTLYNARLDNLDAKVWSHLFGKSHGIICIQSFYEWVRVSDLIDGSNIALRDVETVFSQQKLERKRKIEAAGKKYTQTPTEKLPALERKIIVRFRPETGATMFVPTLVAQRPSPIVGTMHSFAMITTDPSKEVEAAGHDRSPIQLSLANAHEFINLKSFAQDKAKKLLSSPRPDRYVVDLG